MKTQGKRSQIFKGGVMMLVLGAMLGITGFVSSPAGAADKVTICHRTRSISNPYRMITVDLSATHGPDHETHEGSVFDPVVNVKKNKGVWGDIIPNVLNWDEAGRALHAADCQLPGEPADPEACPFDDDFDLLDPECTDPTSELVCDEDQVVVDGVCTDPTSELVCDEDQVVVDGVCTDPTSELVCDEDQVVVDGVCTDPTSELVCDEDQVVVDGVCTTPRRELRVMPAVVPQQTDEVSTNVVEPTQQVIGTEVKGLVLVAKPSAPAAPAATALPRTGTDTLPLTQLGLGLLLLGAGALIIGRDRTITI